MTAITISRQLGSLGSQVARLVADQLGFRLVWRELINQAALRSGAPEAALAAIDELGLFGICPSPQACRAYREAVKQVIEELAAEGGVVIVGRAGQLLLKDRADVLHVRVIAPQAVRAERVARARGVPPQAALAQVEASDRYRANYLKRFYQVRWDQAELYDLVINTARTAAPEAAEVICRALQARIAVINEAPAA